MSNRILYIDYDRGEWCDSDGGRGVAAPKLLYMTKPTWEIRAKSVASGTVAAVDLSSAATWKAAVDHDYAHNHIDGALTAAKSGAVTAITVDGVATTPPLAGVIKLTNGSSESESVGYTEWTLNTGVYTFVVSATLTYSYAENDAVEIENTSPMVRVLDADIDDTDADVGILLVTLDTRNNVFGNALGDSEYLSCIIEILGLDANGIAIHSMRAALKAENSVDPHGGLPPTVTPGNYEYTGGAAAPDKTKRGMEYYFDLERARWCDSSMGAGIAAPRIPYATANQWKLTALSSSSGAVAGVDLSACLAFQVSASNTMQDDTPPVRVVNDSIDSTDKDDGELYAIIDARTTTFRDMIGTSAEVNGYLQIYGFDANAITVVSVRLPVVFLNSVDPVGGSVPTPSENYYTISQTQAYVASRVPKQLTLSSAPTPTTALATIDAAAGVGSWGYWQGYKYIWPTTTRCERIQPEDNW